MQCPGCHAENADHTRFCRQCGNALSAPDVSTTPGITCQKCAAPLKIGTVFCTACGEPSIQASSSVPAPVRKRPLLTLAIITIVIAGAGSFWAFKGKPADGASVATIEPSTPPPVQKPAAPVAAEPSSTASTSAIRKNEYKPGEPQPLEKKTVQKKGSTRDPAVHETAPAVTEPPPRPQPSSNWLDALRRELRECDKRNFFARPLCQERARARFCPDSYFHTTPECQASNDAAAQNRGG